MENKKRQVFCFRVVVSNEDEKQKIITNAKLTNLSVSRYFLNLGLGYVPASNYDIEVVQDLLKINADLGRLGGLLKLWLTNEERLIIKGKSVKLDIEKLLFDISQTQNSLYEQIKQRRILSAKNFSG